VKIISVNIINKIAVGKINFGTFASVIVPDIRKFICGKDFVYRGKHASVADFIKICVFIAI